MLVLIVALPLALVAWLGARMSRNERQMVQLRVEELLVSACATWTPTFRTCWPAEPRAAATAGSCGPIPGELRDLGSSLPEVSHLFVLDQLGALVYPVPAAPLTDNERAFLERTRDIWLDRQLPPRGEEGQAPVQQQMAQQASAPRPTAQMASPKPGSKSGYRAAASQGAAVSADSGWYAWFWRNGVNLLYWWRESGGRIAGAELNRGRMLSEIINALPVTDPRNPTLAEGRIVLRGAQGESLYQWGLYEPGENEAPRASLMLSPPLSSWRLDHYASARMAAPDMGRSVYFNVFRRPRRCFSPWSRWPHISTGRTRGNCAGRAAHQFREPGVPELKTPLTNIRMYAEMLEGELDDAEPRIRKRLGVITSESQRLSRLIGNVLTFSRKQRSALRLRRSPGVVDAVLRNTLEHCAAPLRAKGMEVIFEANAPHMAEFDADAVEQVAGNLLSNVEKYASTGTLCGSSAVRTATGSRCPWRMTAGIPLRERRRVFEPFYRVSNRLTDGVAGTGIGLAIARDLARLHGGDLVLDDSPAGACFTFSFHAPRAYPEETP